MHRTGGNCPTSLIILCLLPALSTMSVVIFVICSSYHARCFTPQGITQSKGVHAITFCELLAKNIKEIKSEQREELFFLSCHRNLSITNPYVTTRLKCFYHMLVIKIIRNKQMRLAYDRWEWHRNMDAYTQQWVKSAVHNNDMK